MARPCATMASKIMSCVKLNRFHAGRLATVTDLSSPDGMRIIFNMPKLLQKYFDHPRAKN
jgi:hypothetical protein